MAGEYVVAVETDLRVPDGYRSVDVPAGSYAVFSATGEPVATAQALVLAAYGRWFDPGILQRQPGGWDVERVSNEPGAPVGARRCELWLPLRA